MLLPRVVKGVSSEEMLDRGVDRRDFLKICSIAAAAVGLPAGAGVKMAEAAMAGQKPSVIWLSFQ
ncbi:MAG: twin-arginine translocation signal domain-containing protein, partial [Thermoanaerobaculia bacterium]